MSVYGKNHYNIVISLQLIKINEKQTNQKKPLTIQKTKIMASGPVSSWQIDGETMETMMI